MIYSNSNSYSHSDSNSNGSIVIVISIIKGLTGIIVLGLNIFNDPVFLITPLDPIDPP